MATNVTSAAIPPGAAARNIEARLRELMLNLDKIVNQAAQAALDNEILTDYAEVAVGVSRSVKAVAPPARITLAKRQLGKQQGRTPSIPRMQAGGQALVASGALLQAIDVFDKGGRPVKLVKGLRGRAIVLLRRQVVSERMLTIPKNARGKIGLKNRPLWPIANLLEFGGVLKIPLTPPSLAYLRALYGGYAGPPEAEADPRAATRPAPVVRVTTAFVPARPAWRNAVRRSLQENPMRFVRNLNRHLRGLFAGKTPVTISFDAEGRMDLTSG